MGRMVSVQMILLLPFLVAIHSSTKKRETKTSTNRTTHKRKTKRVLFIRVCINIIIALLTRNKWIFGQWSCYVVCRILDRCVEFMYDLVCFSMKMMMRFVVQSSMQSFFGPTKETTSSLLRSAFCASM